MAMRSQIYEWDLFKGVQTTGGIGQTNPQALLNGSVKGITKLVIGTEPNNYTNGLTYQAQLKQGELPQNGATITGNPNFTCATVNDPPGNFPGDSGADYQTPLTADTTPAPSGSGYAVADVLVMIGNVAGVAEDDLSNFQVTSIWEKGFGFVLGQVYNTVAVTGSGSGATFEITNVNADGEVFGASVIDAGSGYQVGDLVDIVNPASPETPVRQLVSQIISDGLTGNTYVELGKPFSIFTEKGNTLPNNPSTKENQFIVVESFGCTATAFFPGKDNGADTSGANQWVDTNPTSPTFGQYRGQILKNSLFGPRAYMQFYINSTAYFKDSDGVVRNGIPGTFAPYPLSLQYDVCIDRKQPPVYILPRQAWDLKITCFNQFSNNDVRTGVFPSGTDDLTINIADRLNQLTCFFKYVLYDGIDMVIAMRLLEAGIRITPENVDEFKRNIFENNITLPNDEEE